MEGWKIDQGQHRFVLRASSQEPFALPNARWKQQNTEGPKHNILLQCLEKPPFQTFQGVVGRVAKVSPAPTGVSDKGVVLSTQVPGKAGRVR